MGCADLRVKGGRCTSAVFSSERMTKWLGGGVVTGPPARPSSWTTEVGKRPRQRGERFGGAAWQRTNAVGFRKDQFDQLLAFAL